MSSINEDLPSSASDSSPVDKPVVSSTGYGRILKASSIIGGSSVYNYALGIIKTKFVAVLLGPSGVGLVGIYNSLIALSSTVSIMGLNSSGVREISASKAKGDNERIGQIQVAIRRIAVILGMLGALCICLLAGKISNSLFGTDDHILAIRLLSVLLIIAAFRSSQGATLQGFREVGALAKVSIISASAGLVLAISLYAVLGERGIVPVILTLGITTTFVSWWYARRLFIRPVSNSWRNTLHHAKHLLPMGAALAWGALLSELVPFFARALIVRELGTEANGLYVAAWAISGLFINFLLSAMWADYFPRLSASADDPVAVRTIVNEQTEMGVLIALPGVLLLLACAPLVIWLLYTSAFVEAATLMPWLLLGLFGRITSWPMGIIMLAKGDSKVFAITQTVSVGLHLILIIAFFQSYGLQGIAIAFAVNNIVYNLALVIFLRIRYGFLWNATVVRMIATAIIAYLITAATQVSLKTLPFALVAFVVVSIASVISLTELYRRLGHHPKIKRYLNKLPQPILRVLDKIPTL